MLSEIIADVLQFLSRRDLDKASGVSKWLDAMIAQFCEMYPLRPVQRVELHQQSYCYKFSTEVWFNPAGARTSFNSMGEAAHFTGSILRHSLVKELELFRTMGTMALTSGHWATLVDAMRMGSVGSLTFRRIRFSAFDENAFLAAVGCRRLQSLTVRDCVVPSGCVTDALIRACGATGLRYLYISENNGDASHRLSEEAILDFVFATASESQSRDVTLPGSGITDMFVKNFLERLQSRPIRPSGTLSFHGATGEQRGLSAYAQYRAPDVHGPILHRFPSTDDNDSSYTVAFYANSSWLRIWFHPEPLSD